LTVYCRKELHCTCHSSKHMSKAKLMRKWIATKEFSCEALVVAGQHHLHKSLSH
jgi:hypothetical protein